MDCVILRQLFVVYFFTTFLNFKLQFMLKNIDIRPKQKNRIKADVIILGCSLPGIVTAHKLKTRFGNSMDIMVLDIEESAKYASKCGVGFHEADEDDSQQTDVEESDRVEKAVDHVAAVAKSYIVKYAKEFKIALPEPIVAPEQSQLTKVFQHLNGNTVECASEYHDFDYLNFMEKFELNQYQKLLDQSMRLLFEKNADGENKHLLYYDQTTMEKHICDALFFNTSREIMRTTVKVICGASASTVSVLFYLHQCYRTNGTRNHLDGDNTRLREKLIGYCNKRISHKLQQSVADITQAVKRIKEIRTYPEEQVIVETMKGEATYVCNMLAMALKPNELRKIRVEDVLLSKRNAKVTGDMIPGMARKFIVQYKDNFWNKQGYSGDILSIRGPIVWAMERPRLSTTGSTERYSALIGYLVVRDSDECNDSREAALEQLVKLFGEEAATPTSYTETDIADVFIPRCGDYVALRMLTHQESSNCLEWASLDIFADGDVAAALQAGHTAYIHLLSCLRPQAQTYEDVISTEWPTFLSESPLPRWLAQVNISSSVWCSVYLSVSFILLRYFKTYVHKTTNLTNSNGGQ